MILVYDRNAGGGGVLSAVGVKPGFAFKRARNTKDTGQRGEGADEVVLA